MRLILLVVLGSCAPLNTATMRDSCRAIYNECLNGCQRTTPRQMNGTDWQIDLAACTNRCNDQARACG